VLLAAQDLENQKVGVLLHSHPVVEGLNRTKLGDSRAGWHYEYWVHVDDWINHDIGKFWWTSSVLRARSAGSRGG
jgi:hypothetical protein